MNKLVKSIPYSNLYSEFLLSLNGILQLTNRELELLTMLLDLDINYKKVPNHGKNIINKNNRKLIRSTLCITPDNLSRYFGKFKERGILIKGSADDEIFINKALIPEIIKDRVQVTIILNIKNDTK